MYGYLRETEEAAVKAGIDVTTNICRTGLDTYLNIIFPEIDDWVHDKCIDCLPQGIKSRRRPDYRSEKLKLIVEFDGLLHFQNPEIILKDAESTKFYNSIGYKIVRIPYFIQLTNKAVNKLFGRDVSASLFPENFPSLSIENRNTPAFLCPAGIKRMAEIFSQFSEQYKVNIDFLDTQDNDFLTGVSLLKHEMLCYNL